MDRPRSSRQSAQYFSCLSHSAHSSAATCVLHDSCSHVLAADIGDKGMRRAIGARRGGTDPPLYPKTNMACSPITMASKAPPLCLAKPRHYV
eukprot:1313039-Pleurochrysis_carterae.AAC.3